MPSLTYDILYMVPGAIFIAAGAGYQSFDSDAALGFRLGTGLSLPLARPFEFITDVNLIMTPAGTIGTPITLDWLIGFGMRY